MTRTGSGSARTRAPPTGDPRVLLRSIASSRRRWLAPPCGCRGASGIAALDAAVATLCGEYGDAPDPEVAGEAICNILPCYSPVKYRTS